MKNGEQYIHYNDKEVRRRSAVRVKKSIEVSEQLLF